MRRILITGATGFIGRHLLATLQAQYEVIVLGRSRPVSDAWTAVDWIEQDLAKPLDYSRLPQHVDAVIHLAQSEFYKQFPQRAQDIFEVNINSTFRLLEYARQVGAEHFVFASSGGVYEYSGKKIAETDPIRPLNFYLTSKYAAELLMGNYQQFFRTVALRFFFVYGAGQRGMLIPALRHKVMNEEPLLIEGNPGIRINPIHVTDAVRVVEAALHLPASGEFNVAGDETVTITDLVKLIARVLDKEPLIEYRDARIDGDLVADNARMKEVLGIYPRTSLLEGLSSLA